MKKLNRVINRLSDHLIVQLMKKSGSYKHIGKILEFLTDLTGTDEENKNLIIHHKIRQGGRIC